MPFDTGRLAFHIHPEKITRYLLTTSPAATPEARGKSRFFQGIGYTPDNWTALRDALLQHPQTSSLEDVKQNKHGRQLLFRCSMPVAPNGGTYCLRSVWQEREDRYWFSTAYAQAVAR